MVCEVNLSTRSSKCSGSSAFLFGTCDGSLSPKKDPGGQRVLSLRWSWTRRAIRNPITVSERSHWCIEFALSAVRFNVFAQSVAVLGAAHTTSAGCQSCLC